MAGTDGFPRWRGWEVRHYANGKWAARRASDGKMVEAADATELRVKIRAIETA